MNGFMEGLGALYTLTLCLDTVLVLEGNSDPSLCSSSFSDARVYKIRL